MVNKAAMARFRRPVGLSKYLVGRFREGLSVLAIHSFWHLRRSAHGHHRIARRAA